MASCDTYIPTTDINVRRVAAPGGRHLRRDCSDSPECACFIKGLMDVLFILRHIAVYTHLPLSFPLRDERPGLVQ